ncbi:uncharacterized protein LOC118437064 [Folsomia candida]|uniref:uncharacterized protein LOC118437064 n=1 Tax=Folsomia candida TaxID=158441 RepID=UPI001604E18A|nr:uncharacterized protein LOC118437064 [Folsomia candida]
MDLPWPSTRVAMVSADYISTCNDSIVATTSAMSKALMNPLILDNIFHHLCIPDLKSCRLVSHCWDDHGATLLGKRTFFDVNQLFDYNSGSNLYLVTQLVCYKLTRSLKIYDEFDLLAQRHKAIDIITKGLRMLQSNDIRHVCLIMEDVNNPADECVPQKIPVHPNLTSIKYRPYKGLNSSNDLHPFVQGLIDSAPNLTFLDVWGSSLLNLERCIKLKSLKFYVINSDFTKTINDVIALLGQVKDTLAEAELIYNSNLCNSLQVKL